MGISSKGPDLARSISGIGEGATTQAAEMAAVAPATETVTAPPEGERATLSHGPLVEDNLELTSASGITYEHGADYIEDIEGGFENLRIPTGTQLTADYFYYDASPLGEGEISRGAAETSRGPRYATLLKMGV